MSAKQFWKGWAAEVAIGAAIGAATGAFTAGAGALAARAGTEIARTGGTQISVWIAKAAIHGGAEVVSSVMGSVVGTYAGTAASNAIQGKDEKVTAAVVLQGIGEGLAGVAGGKTFSALKKAPGLWKGAKGAVQSGRVAKIVAKNNSIGKFKANGANTIWKTLNRPAPVKYTFTRLEI